MMSQVQGQGHHSTKALRKCPTSPFPFRRNSLSTQTSQIQYQSCHLIGSNVELWKESLLPESLQVNVNARVSLHLWAHKRGNTPLCLFAHFCGTPLYSSQADLPLFLFQIDRAEIGFPPCWYHGVRACKGSYSFLTYALDVMWNLMTFLFHFCSKNFERTLFSSTNLQITCQNCKTA